jgi:hypothetical protein
MVDRRPPLGPRRGRFAPGGGAAPRPGLSGRALQHLRGQRLAVRLRPAATGLRRARRPADPFQTRKACRARQDRTVLPHGARAQFLTEIAVRGVACLDELNSLFTAWWSRSTTVESTARPVRPRLNGSPQTVSPRCPAPRSFARRFCGPRPALWPRRPRSFCTATATRSTPNWSAARSRSSSTRST